MRTFLVEIGTEELPPKTLRILAESFSTNFIAELVNANLAHDRVEWFASPRRLALKVYNLCETQPDTESVKRGPAIAQAFDKNGNPTPAAIGWAKSCGITVEQSERLVIDKGEWLTYTLKQSGKPTQQLLLGLVSHALNKLPITKPMRWGDKETLFIRPVHTVTLLYGDELIQGEILGVQSNRIILGHRFMGKPSLKFDHAEQYPQRLAEEGHVIADYQQRKAFIRQHILANAEVLNGHVDLDDNLLEEVNSLVEWPVVLTAKFEETFLSVPTEALVQTMKNDQKYFPVYANDNKLLPNFIFVSNIDSNDVKQVISGNEKVIRPRLADAEFFFKTDRKQRLEEYLPRLETILFQQQLGTLRDKTDRIQTLAGIIAKQIGADVNLTTRAGLLSKCDLMTNMVFEFPETQGAIGMHYARYDGEDDTVAVSLYQQYFPRFSGDALPDSLIACAVAIADKMDTICGIFGIGKLPKGDKDPYALRRAAIGILRILVQKHLSLDLVDLINASVKLYHNKLTNRDVTHDVIEFIFGRFRAWYQEQNYAIDTIQAVLARKPTKPTDFDARVQAVTHFRQLKSATELAEANKRVSNILSKVNETISDQVNASLLTEPAEINLAETLLKLQTELQPLFASENYQQALAILAKLHEPLTTFFDTVMVMVDDHTIRQNRLALLKHVRELFLRIADISLLQN